jgi:hypothetical protein
MLRNVSRLFLVILLVTEFYYIPIGGGFARIYHFFALLVVLLHAGRLPRLLRSPVLGGLLLFIAVNFVAVGLSDDQDRAMASFLGFSGNVLVALAVALILQSERLSVAQFKRLVLGVTLVSVGWGAIQIAVFRVAGLNLALSPEQHSQIAIGFGPGFRTEANTFGKYMVFAFLFFIPDYVASRRERSQRIGWAYAVFCVGILMNFTRSAVLGTVIGLCLVVFWYGKRGLLQPLLRRGLVLAIPLAVGVALLLTGALGVSEYAKYKIANLFEKDELVSGESSEYRLQMMQVVLENTLASPKKLVIGNGWGQTRATVNDVEVQAGGGDGVNVLGYAGIVGVAAYVGYMFLALLAARAVARRDADRERARFAQGTMFALFGLFFTAQVSGVLIAPEYWLLVGSCIHLGVRRRAVARHAAFARAA